MLLNVVIGSVVVGLTIIVQGFGTTIWVSEYDKRRRKLTNGVFKKRIVKLFILTGIFLLFIHLVQAVLWALVYLYHPGITEFETFEESLYFSLVTFSTLGYGEITIGSTNRILAGLEAINGITLIGWSTALMFAGFQELIKVRFGKVGKNDVK